MPAIRECLSRECWQLLSWIAALFPSAKQAVAVDALLARHTVEVIPVSSHGTRWGLQSQAQDECKDDESLSSPTVSIASQTTAGSPEHAAGETNPSRSRFSVDFSCKYTMLRATICLSFVRCFVLSFPDLPPHAHHLSLCLVA